MTTTKKKTVARLQNNLSVLAAPCVAIAFALLNHTAIASIAGTDANVAIEAAPLTSKLQSISGTDSKLLLASDVAALGQVESIDVRGRTLTVLGQKYQISSTTRFVRNELFSGVRILKFLSVGDFVAVTGQVGPSALQATAVINAAGRYVSGASTVYVKGQITSNDPALGRVFVGTLAIDYTALPSFSDFSALGVGSTVELSGIQPLAVGLVLANDASVISARSIAGTDARSIAGTDATSIAGTDARSISGTDATSIAGTDARSIAGTDATSIAGTDARSIAGTDARSITGTDF